LRNLKEHSLNSIKWVGLGNLMHKLFTPVISIYIATILDPKDYGLVAISAFFIGFANLIQGFGMKDYIVKEEALNKNLLNTAFWFNVFIAISLFVILFTISGLIANLYNEKLLKIIIPISGLAIIIDSLGTVQLALLRREMQFKKLFFIRFAPIIVSISVVLPMALAGYGVWALVCGQITRSFLTNSIYWMVGKWKPSFSFSMDEFRRIRTFGIWIVIERGQEYFMGRMNVLFLGYFADVTMLGVYSVARHIIGSILLLVRAPLQNITLPMLSKLQGGREKLLNGFYKIIKRMLMINIPLIFGIVLLSPKVIPLVFESKWVNLPIALAILIVGRGVLSCFGAQRELYKIINRPDIYPKSIFVSIIIGVISYSIAANYGLIVFCIVNVFNDFLFVMIQMIIMNKVINFNYKQLFYMIRQPLFSSICMGAAICFMLYLGRLINVEFNFFFLFFIVLLGVSVYGVLFKIIDNKEFKKVLREMYTILGIEKLSKRV